MGPWWKERLDELRRGNQPRHEQPGLRLPLPPCEPSPNGDLLEDDEPQEGTAVIDFTF